VNNEIHTCNKECQRPNCIAVRESIKAERKAIANLIYEMAMSNTLADLEKYRTFFIAEFILARENK
jgi:hypothetical protein